jgi:hypothetical protein
MPKAFFNQTLIADLGNAQASCTSSISVSGIKASLTMVTALIRRLISRNVAYTGPYRVTAN